MGIIAKIKGWFDMIFKKVAKEDFKVDTIVSSRMEQKISECARIYSGNPSWIDKENGIKTINFAKAVCSETARLATIGIKLTIGGSARADWLQKQIDSIYFKLRDWVEYGCAYGTIVLIPDGKSVDLITPDRFIVTDQSNGEITGIVFIHREISENGKKYYTRLEYHRFLDSGLYAVSNKCYVSDNENDRVKPVSIEDTPWKGMLEEAVMENIDKPLYGVLKMPHANNIDINSPLGLSIFSDAIEELKDLDIAYSRNAEEIFDSRKIVLLDSDRLLPSGGKVNNTISGIEKAREDMKLPKYIKSVYGMGSEEVYHEINPELQTDKRLTGLNALLSQIGYKIGYSNGYFVFNESTGMVTATQVESDDRRTMQFIKDIRDKLESCLGNLIYAINAIADLYELLPAGEYEVVYDFGDITYNREEDKKTWWGYVVSGKVPAWMYFEKFEGMSKEEALKMVNEAQPKAPKLFEEE